MSAETALKLVETSEVETKALSIVDQARAVKVIDSESYTAAGGLWKSIGDMIKEVKDTFDPICDKAFATHREATQKRAKYLDPLMVVYKSVKALMSAYDEEQLRIAKAEADRLMAIARKEEEERLLLDAIAAEEEAMANGATKEEAAQEAAAIINEPVYVPPVTIAKSTPRIAGGPVFSTRWSASVTDIKALCFAIGAGTASTEFVIGLDRDKDTGIITSPSLNKQATSLRGTLSIPGVRAISKRM